MAGDTQGCGMNRALEALGLCCQTTHVLLLQDLKYLQKTPSLSLIIISVNKKDIKYLISGAQEQ